MTPKLRALGTNLAVAGVYFVSGKFGLSLAFVNASASAVWPPTGIALAVLLLGGYRLWPGVFAGALLVNLTTQGSVLTVLGIATGNTLEAFTGAWLVNRFAGGKHCLDRMETFFRFVLLAGVLSTIISPTLGVASLALAGFASWDQYGAIWFVWWLGDMTSNFLIAPLLLVWLTQRVPAFSVRDAVEAGCLVLTLLLTGLVCFLGEGVSGSWKFALTYLAIPPLVWAAFRFDQRGAVTASFLMAGLALWGALAVRGPFTDANPGNSLLHLQAFLGTIALFTLTLALAVAERKRSRRALEASQARLHGIIDSAMDAILSVDDQQRVVLFNRAAELMFRCSAREALGQPREKFIPGLLPQTGRSSEVAGAAESSPSGETPGRTLTAVRSNGEPFPIEASVSQVNVGQGAFSTIIVRDVTERQRAELQLRLHAVALESAANAIVITDREGRIEWVNPAFTTLTGFRAQDVLGKSPRVLRSGHHPPEFFRAMWETLRSGAVWHGEVVNKRRDGTLYTEEMTITPVVNRGQGGTHFIAIKQDITARKQAEAALEEAKERLARANADLENLVSQRTAELRDMVADLEHFSYSIVHDMRAPLRAIQSFGALIEQEAGSDLPGNARQFLARMRGAATRMDQLITDALAFSQAVRKELQLRPVDPAALLQGMLESYPEFDHSRAAITIREKMPAVLGNEAALTQCFSNLLHNAVKFTKPGCKPEVLIRAESLANNRVRIWIEDQGIGIPVTGLNRIFGMFQRLHGSEYEGTGIGLALVRKVVERMGGQVGVESTPGQGSRFWVELKSAPLSHATASQVQSGPA